MKIYFSRNLHDDDGDVTVKGLFLHFDEMTIIRLENEKELEQVVANLQRIQQELAENYTPL
jgi:hypothetical protein